MIEQEIKQIIEQNLPAAVGDVLRKRLEQAELDKKNLETERARIEQLNKQVSSLEKELEIWRENGKKHGELLAREESVSKRERQLEITLLTQKLESEKEKSKFAFDVTMGLVRNTVYRRNLLDNVSEPVRDQYGNYMPINKYQNSTETTEEQ